MSTPREWPPTTLRRIPLGFVPRAQNHTIQLTEEQREVASSVAAAPRALLDGPAGSGKTHIAAMIAAGYAAMGRRVLFLCTRHPLALWLRQELAPVGVTVQTISGCARDVLASRSPQPPERHSYDDPEYFLAAQEAARPDAYDVVIGDEWQTTTDTERGFVARLAERGRYLEVIDSSRDLREERRGPPAGAETFTLSSSLRSPGEIEKFDAMYAKEGLDPFPGRGGRVTLTALGSRENLQERVQNALRALVARGFAPGEIGVVSALSRAQSALVTRAVAFPAGLRPYQLHQAPALSGLACDSFAYWLGLERRAIIVVEAPTTLPLRRTRLHNAISRATDLVHLILPKDQIEADPCLREWQRLLGPGKP